MHAIAERELPLAHRADSQRQSELRVSSRSGRSSAVQASPAMQGPSGQLLDRLRGAARRRSRTPCPMPSISSHRGHDCADRRSARDR